MRAWLFSHQTRILAVDDEAGFTRLLQLAAPHYEIRTECDPLHAVEAAKEFQPDLILLDRYMPRMSGDRLAATLKADPKLSKIPIAFITAAVPYDSDGHPCPHLYGFPVLTKPVSIEMIDRCVAECVRA